MKELQSGARFLPQKLSRVGEKAYLYRHTKAAAVA